MHADVRRPNRCATPPPRRRRHFAAAVRESGAPALFSMTIAQRVPLVHKENTFVAADSCGTPFVRTVSTDARVMAVINATRVQSKHRALTCRDNVSFGIHPVPFPTPKRNGRHKTRDTESCNMTLDRIESNFIRDAWEERCQEFIDIWYRIPQENFACFFSFVNSPIFCLTKMSRRLCYRG